MKPFPILLDIDEVVLHWNSGFHAWMKRTGFDRATEDETQYSLQHAYPHVDTVKCIEMFSKSRDYIDLGTIVGARLGIADLRRRYPSSPIFAVTCCGRDPSVVRVRAAALERFKLDGLIPLEITEHKTNVYKCFSRGLVIEDSPKNITAAGQAGHLVLTFDQPWNQGEVKRRVHGWHEIMSEETHDFIRSMV